MALDETEKTREKESGREEDAPLSASPKTNQTGASLTNQRHPSAADAQLVRAARTDAVDAVDARRRRRLMSRGSMIPDK